MNCSSLVKNVYKTTILVSDIPVITYAMHIPTPYHNDSILLGYYIGKIVALPNGSQSTLWGGSIQSHHCCITSWNRQYKHCKIVRSLALSHDRLWRKMEKLPRNNNAYSERTAWPFFLVDSLRVIWLNWTLQFKWIYFMVGLVDLTGNWKYRFLVKSLFSYLDVLIAACRRTYVTWIVILVKLSFLSVIFRRVRGAIGCW